MNEPVTWTPGVTLDAIEEQIIKKAILHFKNKTTTAASLGIAIRTLDYKLVAYEEKKEREELKQLEKKQKDEEFLLRCRGLLPPVPQSEPMIQQPVSASIESFDMTNLRGKKNRT